MEWDGCGGEGVLWGGARKECEMCLCRWGVAAFECARERQSVNVVAERAEWSRRDAPASPFDT